MHDRFEHLTEDLPLTTSVTASAIPLTRLHLDGRLVTPGDADYDELRMVVRGATDARPAAIARVAHAEDVARVVSFCAEAGVELAVRSGGHSGAGHGASEGGIVIDLRDLKRIEVDPESRTAWAETGLTAGEVTDAVGAHGLAIGFGDTGSVGIGGITVGGGIGYLVRAHGMTIDNVLGAEVVTADGRIREVDAEREPDLFWAIRGGGGNVGVVTRFRYRLHELPEVLGGMLVLPATPETLAGFIAAAESAPEELSAIVNVMPCPPMPMLPEELHGSLVILGLMCHAGGGQAGERAMVPFRRLADPLVDLVKPMPYAGMFPPEESGYRPTAVAHTMFLDHVSRGDAALMLDGLRASDAPMRAVQLRVLGGAMARVAPDATAYAHRSARIMAIVVSFYEGEEGGADYRARRGWVSELVRGLDQGVAGAYVNFLDDEGPERVRQAYPGATWDRLAAVKARYDPTNLFHRNQNVPPA